MKTEVNVQNKIACACDVIKFSVRFINQASFTGQSGTHSIYAGNNRANVWKEQGTKELLALEDLNGDDRRFGYPQQPIHEGYNAYQ